MNELENITEKLRRRQDLTQNDVEGAIDFIAANNNLDESSVLDFLDSTNNKEISAEELYYFVSSMRKYSRRVIVDDFVTDSCGTGADMSSTVNISTISAIAASSLGLKVIKQTNSSITSSCGSTNLLQELNIPVVKTPQEAVSDFNRNGIAFVHSPNFNAFAEVNNVYRRKLGKKTIFNYLGPLINPSFPEAQLLGVSSSEMCPKIAEVLLRLGTKRALVVNSQNPNMDEISLCSETDIYELNGGGQFRGEIRGKIDHYTVSSEDFGFKRCKTEDLQGGDSRENARIAREILSGKNNSPMTDIILLNASGMLYLGGKCKSINDGIPLVKEAIVFGKTQIKLASLAGSTV